MRIAYLVNQYPMVSVSFIRREIAALEAMGLAVRRYAIRRWHGPLVDPADHAEVHKTQYILSAGVTGLSAAAIVTAITRPRRFLTAMGLAWRMGWRSQRGVGRHLAYLAEACVLRRWMVRDRITHVHTHFGTNSTTVAMLTRVLGGPGYSFTVHGPEEFDQPAALGLPEKIDRAAFVVGVSSFGRSQLMRWCPYEQWDKLKVVHCGLDAMFLETAGQADTTDASPSPPRLVCVGRLCEQKGQLLLVEAVGRLLRDGVSVELVLVGDGEMRPQVEALVSRLGIEASVRITGWATAQQVRQELLNARAMVLPSFAEGLPVVLMEAMALRCVVVTTCIAGIPELIEHGRSGLLVPAGDVEALVTALRQVMEMDDDTRRRIGDAAAERVRQRHDARQEAARLAEHFKTAAAAGP
jgi:colanic acid/amylovoran biosynthesis glycosyltransferase